MTRLKCLFIRKRWIRKRIIMCGLLVGFFITMWKYYILRKYSGMLVEGNFGSGGVPVLNIEIENKVVNRTALVLTRYFERSENEVLHNYEALIKEDEAFMIPGLGDGGVPSFVSNDIGVYAKALIKKEAFNIILSDMMPYTRKLHDARNPKCKEQTFDRNLPTASVVIIFNNEAWSPLIRTIHSVLNRSPDHLLKEIVLIDDCSDREVLNGKLEHYLKTRLPKKVHLHWLLMRSGLIRARLAGAERAKGEVLVFLDSHCEVIEQWLEPLLQRIKEKRSNIAVPIIDVIDDKTLEYLYNKLEPEFFQVGGFTWSGHFTWINIPADEVKLRNSSIAPARSPTIAGGLFAVDRKYFWEIGAYDDQMDIWGGENLEMSFRVWQCGGSMEIIPCSRVGHIFRVFYKNDHPFAFSVGKDTHGINTARLAEVWMDGYKRLFYMNRPDLKNVNIGDLTQRLELRKNLKCKSFKWYLNNVYPEKFILDENVLAFGRVHAILTDLCLDHLQREKGSPYNLGVYACHNLVTESQYFSLSKTGELRREESCAEVEVSDDFPRKVIMYKCHGELGNQQWKYTKIGELHNVLTGLCADSVNLTPGSNLLMNICSGTSSQQWIWDHILVNTNRV